MKNFTAQDLEEDIAFYQLFFYNAKIKGLINLFNTHGKKHRDTMRLTALRGKYYGGRDGKSLKTIGEFSLQDDRNETKEFVFTGERNASTGRWEIGKHTLLDKKTKIPLFKLVPNKSFSIIVSKLEDILTERVKKKYVIDCNVQIGNGGKETYLKSVGEEVEIRGSLVLKNKGNLTLDQTNMEVSKNTVRKSDGEV